MGRRSQTLVLSIFLVPPGSQLLVVGDGLAGGRPAGNGASEARLTVSSGGFLLEMPGQEPSHYASLDSLLREAAGREGKFVILPSPGKARPEEAQARPIAKKSLAEPAPERRQRPIKIGVGDIPLLEFARFLADFTGLPVLARSDKQLEARTILMVAPIEAADFEVVKRILAVHKIRITEEDLAGKGRVILLEPMEADAEAVEPVERPIVIDKPPAAERRTRFRSKGSRLARGPEPAKGTQGGIEFAPVPAILTAQVDLPEGRGVLVAAIDENARRGKSEVGVLMLYDIITHVNESSLSSVEDLRAALDQHAPGEAIVYRVLRKGSLRILTAHQSPR